MIRRVLVTTRRTRHRSLRRPSPLKRVPITECTLMLDTGVFTSPMPLDERFREYRPIWRWCYANLGANWTGWAWIDNRVYIVEDAEATAFVMRWRGALIDDQIYAESAP